MNEYTIVSARYANEDNSAAIIHTVEFGDVCISLQDRPELWQQMLEFGQIAAYQES